MGMNTDTSRPNRLLAAFGEEEGAHELRSLKPVAVRASLAQVLNKEML